MAVEVPEHKDKRAVVISQLEECLAQTDERPIPSGQQFLKRPELGGRLFFMPRYMSSRVFRYAG